MKFLLPIVFFFGFLISVVNVQAATITVDCNDPANKNKIECTLGTINPPPAIKDLLGKDQTGATGIGNFLSNLIVLIYSIAAIVLVFMLLWGAFDWLISEGDKERLSAAQNKIIAAIVGIMLFAAAFAIIQVLGKFTGFTFFVQK